MTAPEKIDRNETVHLQSKEVRGVKAVISVPEKIRPILSNRWTASRKISAKQRHIMMLRPVRQSSLLPVGKGNNT